MPQEESQAKAKPKTWVERFPDPGAQPPHPGAKLEMPNNLADPEVYKQWRVAHDAWYTVRQTYNDWVIARRKHEIACGVEAEMALLTHLREASLTVSMQDITRCKMLIAVGLQALDGDTGLFGLGIGGIF